MTELPTDAIRTAIIAGDIYGYPNAGIAIQQLDALLNKIAELEANQGDTQ